MRIICDVGHPAHVHLFRHVLSLLERRGHRYLVTARDKDVTINLLDAYNMRYTCLGEHYGGIAAKAYGMLKYDVLLAKKSLEFGADLFISHGSVYASHVSVLLGKPHISMEDTGNMEQIKLYLPLTRTVLTAECFPYDLGIKQIRYNSYHELAYLHPKYYTPNPSILGSLGVSDGEIFVIVRFVSREATHDSRNCGISLQNKTRAVHELSKYVRVFISSENSLPEGIAKYRLVIRPEDMHDVLYYAALLYGESATMASECAVLGTPAIFVYNKSLGYTDEEEQRYGLIYNFTESPRDQIKSLEKAFEILKQPNFKKRYRAKRNRLIKDKIDVAAFLTWFIEDYPASVKIMKEDNQYQLRFR